ncbi:unnamed protein product, partial [marine sediment metagenome]
MEEDRLKIETPESIDLSFELAGIGSRFVAQLLDDLLKVLIIAVVAIGAAFLIPIVAGGFQSQVITYIGVGLLIGILFIIYFGYDIYFEAKNNGQTPGKKMAGIRVIKDGGYPLDLPAVFIRNLVGIVDTLPSYYILGAIVMILNKKQQRLGDMAAGTIVIRERDTAYHSLPFGHKKYS